MKKLAFSCVFASFLCFGLISIAFSHDGGDAGPELPVVHMTAEGFDPTELEVPLGTTVIFENADSRPRWPASNIHPTHAVYPGSNIRKCGKEVIFDACRAISPGEEFWFTFSEPGEWRFHDHIFPEFSGTIVVIGKKIEENSRVSLYERMSSLLNSVRFSIMRAYYVMFPKKLEERLSSIKIFEIAEDESILHATITLAGPERVMKKLLDEAGGGTTIDCHQEAHQVGRIAYEVFGASVFEKGDASCHSGYYHGAMESFLTEKGTTNLSKNISELCRIFETRFGVFECLHGVGHGVMAYENYDLPKALDLCSELADDFSQRSCYGGVFMENIVAAQGLGAIPGHETKWVSTDPYFPCNTMGDDYGRNYECYQMQTSWMLSLTGYNFDWVSRYCLDAPIDMRSVCFKSFGRDAAGYTLRDPGEILRLCQKVPRTESYYDQCIVGALNVIIDFWGPALDQQAREFCEAIPDSATEEMCLTTLEIRLPELFGELQS